MLKIELVNNLKIIWILVFSMFCYVAIAQEFSIAGKYVRSDLTQFQTGMGVEASISSYDRFNNRISVLGSITNRSKSYEYSIFLDAFGEEFQRYVEPNNFLFSIALSYDWPILKSNSSAVFIGFNLSINSFIFNEKGTQNAQYESIFHDYSNNSTEDFNPGIGVNFEYERAFNEKGTIVYFAFQPSIVKYYKFNIIGTSKPALIDLIDYKVGVRFKGK